MEISVRTNGSTGRYTVLAPRQSVAATPYAMVAGTSTSLMGALPAAQISGALPATQVSGTLSLTQMPQSIITNTQQSVTLHGSFSGNGGGLTNVSYDVVNVKHYGAAGDGSHDDTTAIQSAVNSTIDKGGVLYFPKGRYKVSSTITLPRNGNQTPGGGSLPRYQLLFKGDGQGNSHIVMSGTGDLFNASFAWAGEKGYYAMADHYSFNDLDFVGPGTSSQGTALHFGLTDEGLTNYSWHEGVQWLKVEDCHITGFASGIAVTNCVEMFLTRVFFESNYMASASLKKVDSVSVVDCFIGFDWQYGNGADKTLPYEGIVLRNSLFFRAVNGTFQSCKRVFNMYDVTVASVEGANWEDDFDGTEVILSRSSAININNPRIGGGPNNPNFAFLRTDEAAQARVDNVAWQGDTTSSLIISRGIKQPIYFMPPSRTDRALRYSVIGGKTNTINANFGASTLLLAPVSWNYMQHDYNAGKTFYVAPSEWNAADAGYYLVRTKLNSTNVVVEDMIPSNLLQKDMQVNGAVTATNGLASLRSNNIPAITCSIKGWTNTWNVSAMIYAQGSSFTVKKNGVNLFQNVNGGVTIKAQPGEAVLLSGTVTSVYAEPF
jgi:hypothetical protein